MLNSRPRRARAPLSPLYSPRMGFATPTNAADDVSGLAELDGEYDGALGASAAGALDGEYDGALGASAAGAGAGGSLHADARGSSAVDSVFSASRAMLSVRRPDDLGSVVLNSTDDLGSVVLNSTDDQQQEQQQQPQQQQSVVATLSPEQAARITAVAARRARDAVAAEAAVARLLNGVKNAHVYPAHLSLPQKRVYLAGLMRDAEVADSSSSEDGAQAVAEVGQSQDQLAARQLAVEKAHTINWLHEKPSEEVRSGDNVFLHIYHVKFGNSGVNARRVNFVLSKLFGRREKAHRGLGSVLGAYHVGLEVHGHEWCYGYCEVGSGVGWILPRSNAHHIYEGTLSLGRTELSRAEVLRIVTDMSEGERVPPPHLAAGINDVGDRTPTHSPSHHD